MVIKMSVIFISFLVPMVSRFKQGHLSEDPSLRYSHTLLEYHRMAAIKK